jgi:hypothetical protein
LFADCRFDGLTCFGRHIAHHQELKNCNCSLWFYTRFCLPIAAAMVQHVSGDTSPIIRSSKTLIAASGFTYVFGCRFPLCSHCSGNRQPKTYVKPEAAIKVFELLMMGNVSPETC